ncbi:hypothetical protein GCM10009839_31680 [Catenulispora yoronensis]|uniref:Uncharacterized protein n=1 Tax=Catenulispora yoronensis TaxID=450799 RepID=A0ABN2U6D7_9ACTN
MDDWEPGKEPAPLLVDVSPFTEPLLPPHATRETAAKAATPSPDMRVIVRPVRCEVERVRMIGNLSDRSYAWVGAAHPDVTEGDMPLRASRRGAPPPSAGTA